ncbi:hypothetical protein BDK51DRAFT_12045, partial [Blyttiomyces helicus]
RTHPSDVLSPALLSQVAQSFRSRIPRGPHAKGYVEHAESFTGHEAVTLLAEIIRYPTDRSLALHVGRALHAQDLFHDVTYLHRLRDSEDELYQLSNTCLAFLGPGNPCPDGKNGENEWVSPVGVFTPLTACYSPS